MTAPYLLARDGHSSHLESQAEYALRCRISKLEASIALERERVSALLDAIDDRDRRLAEMQHRVGQLTGCGRLANGGESW